MRIGWTLAVAVALVAGCDTGDGTTLRDPDAALPPPTDVAIGSSIPAPDDLTTEPIATNPPPPAADVATLPAPDAAQGFTLIAPWEDGGVIDPRHGCDGINASPPLAWNGVPASATELAIALVDTTDLSRGQPFVHWVMTGIDPASPGIGEDALPIGGVLALNFFGNVDYDGPCPDPGTTGVYQLTLYALDGSPGVGAGTPAAEVLDGILAVAFDERSVTGSSTR